MNKQHAVTGHEATAGCLVRISMLKDDLSAWKNYLLTQRSDTRARHTLVTAIKNIACTAGQTTARGGVTGSNRSYRVRSLIGLTN